MSNDKNEEGRQAQPVASAPLLTMDEPRLKILSRWDCHGKYSRCQQEDMLVAEIRAQQAAFAAKDAECDRWKLRTIDNAMQLSEERQKVERLEAKANVADAFLSAERHLSERLRQRVSDLKTVLDRSAVVSAGGLDRLGVVCLICHAEWMKAQLPAHAKDCILSEMNGTQPQEDVRPFRCALCLTSDDSKGWSEQPICWPCYGQHRHRACAR
jgi:hypothetical protein